MARRTTRSSPGACNAYRISQAVDNDSAEEVFQPQSLCFLEDGYRRDHRSQRLGQSVRGQQTRPALRCGPVSRSGRQTVNRVHGDGAAVGVVVARIWEFPCVAGLRSHPQRGGGHLSIGIPTDCTRPPSIWGAQSKKVHDYGSATGPDSVSAPHYPALPVAGARQVPVPRASANSGEVQTLS